MITILSLLDEVILKPNHFAISNIEKDAECEEYLGFNFNINHLSVKFRKAKITPKKVGQFVTLWKRNTSKQTDPFDENDLFDFYIIATEDDKKNGYFIFSKSFCLFSSKISLLAFCQSFPLSDDKIPNSTNSLESFF